MFLISRKTKYTAAENFFATDATFVKLPSLYINSQHLETTTVIPAELLVQQCLEGDTAAYRKLYDRYAKAMYNTAYRIVNKAADAEDVLQEAFTDAFMQLKAFQQRSTFGAWLKQIVIYKSIYKVKQNRFFIDDISTLEETKEEDSSNGYEPELTVQKIKTAIQQLPDGYRTVLSLYLLEGYDHEEIAEILKVAHVTVRTQYIRAKNKLVEILKAVNVYE